jgi:hypothetical protein
MDKENNWRPYTIPYTGSGATKDETNHWVSSSSKYHAPVAHPPPPGDDSSSTCSAPTTGEDRETTAAGRTDRDKQNPEPYIPGISRSNSATEDSNVPDRFRPSQHGPKDCCASYANPSCLIHGEPVAGKDAH